MDDERVAAHLDREPVERRRPSRVALANGATPVVSMTLYGPSTRTFSKLVIPKLRVAAPAGAASASDGEGGDEEGAHMHTFLSHG